MKGIQQNSTSRFTKGIKNVSFQILFLIIAIQLLTFSCSTEKNAFANKAYHYTTARFNGYFHGKEALKEGKKALYKSHVDNYEEVLEIFRYGDKSQADGQAGNFNRAIAKASKMIGRHSMKFKVKREKVEVNKMIDDCYFLLGQAQFFKMQYDSAAITYKYIINHFKEGSLYYPTYLELIKTYVYQENFVDAETKFKFLEDDKDFPKKLKDELQVLRALYYIKTDDYAQAIKNLVAAIPETKGNKNRVRLNYILAQLYQKLGQEQEASKLYELVAKKAVFYEMEFNAKLSLAKTHQGKDQGKIIAILEKMLKDNKNKEFKDQIYYILAQVYEKSGKEELAVKNYKLSAQTSVNNPKQRALSYLAVADYHFKKPEYIPAQMFYDSSLISLPKDYPNYESIKDKADNLTLLVKHLNTIQREDSLQRVAKLPEQDRLALIDNLIKEVEEAEEAKEIAEQAKLAQIQAQAALQVNQGGWVFDNPGLLASANAEFIVIFGNRKLEDDWRRSDKSTVSITAVEDGEMEDGQELGTQKIAPNKTTDFYLKDLPFSAEAIDSSNEKLKNSFYQAAIIFKDNLNDIPQSNYYFEELNKRFPDNENRAKSLYQLYRNYEKSNQITEATVNKSLILSDYPNSEYALLIKNPNRGAEAEQREKQVAEYYQKIYNLYNTEAYAQVRTEIANVNSSFKETSLSSNLALLDAFALGKIHGRDSFEIALRNIVQDFKGSTPAADAQEILNGIQAQRMSARGQENQVSSADREFDTTSVGVYFYAVIFSDSLIEPGDLLNEILKVNSAELQKYGAKASIDDWGKNKKIILIKKFDDIGTVESYGEGLEAVVLQKNNGIQRLSFPITEKNFFILNRFKEDEKYFQFFKDNY